MAHIQDNQPTIFSRFATKAKAAAKWSAFTFIPFVSLIETIPFARKQTGRRFAAATAFAIVSAIPFVYRIFFSKLTKAFNSQPQTNGPKRSLINSIRSSWNSFWADPNKKSKKAALDILSKIPEKSIDDTIDRIIDQDELLEKVVHAKTAIQTHRNAFDKLLASSLLFKHKYAQNNHLRLTNTKTSNDAQKEFVVLFDKEEKSLVDNHATAQSNADIACRAVYQAAKRFKDRHGTAATATNAPRHTLFGSALTPVSSPRVQAVFESPISLSVNL